MTVEDSDEGGDKEWAMLPPAPPPPICSDELLHVQYLALGGERPHL